ncbi:hypothetical protein OG895_01355 [Streptomyces sp. NBC_00201]|uniref:hypothetical protein n=1 Tax=unclassified Streptomyces TaxID=2593676 RepID=UPI00224FAE8E|nr:MULTISPECIES: hypothetical protein [unclassified Streptomyces]MCX5059454.1 hypothetical protein [Streptomyces sp. NBC_00452]MCX5243901.1 hypothetical protein [Streptomyces sp. NBC_00201]MCX5290365.1 hypothetical protein [Streptomyces sp. NBC_00183]
MAGSPTQGIKTVLQPGDRHRGRKGGVRRPAGRAPAKLAEVTAVGAGVKKPAHDVGGGRPVATFTDPDGSVLGLPRDR